MATGASKVQTGKQSNFPFINELNFLEVLFTLLQVLAAWHYSVFEDLKPLGWRDEMPFHPLYVLSTVIVYRTNTILLNHHILALYLLQKVCSEEFLTKGFQLAHSLLFCCSSPLLLCFLSDPHPALLSFLPLANFLFFCFCTNHFTQLTHDWSCQHQHQNSVF